MDDVLAFCQNTGKKLYQYIPSISWAEQMPGKVETSTQTYSSSGGSCTMNGSAKGPAGEFITRGNPFVRLAGLSGAAAVALGAYGAHAFLIRDDDLKDVHDEEKKKEIVAEKHRLNELYKTANRYHFFHSIALMAVPLTSRPLLTGSLMSTGMAIFCGTIYYNALTKDNSYRRFTPYGGMILIAAWLSMMI